MKITPAIIFKKVDRDNVQVEFTLDVNENELVTLENVYGVSFDYEDNSKVMKYCKIDNFITETNVSGNGSLIVRANVNTQIIIPDSCKYKYTGIAVEVKSKISNEYSVNQKIIIPLVLVSIKDFDSYVNTGIETKVKADTVCNDLALFPTDKILCTTTISNNSNIPFMIDVSSDIKANSILNRNSVSTTLINSKLINSNETIIVNNTISDNKLYLNNHYTVKIIASNPLINLPVNILNYSSFWYIPILPIIVAIIIIITIYFLYKKYINLKVAPNAKRKK